MREFTGEKVKDEDLKLILETAQRYSNWAHGQQTSLIVVRDKEKIKKTAIKLYTQKIYNMSMDYIKHTIDFLLLEEKAKLYEK